MIQEIPSSPVFKQKHISKLKGKDKGNSLSPFGSGVGLGGIHTFLQGVGKVEVNRFTHLS